MNNLNLPPYRAQRKSKPAKPAIPQYCKDRYEAAHELDFKTQYPDAYKSGHYFKTKIPDVRTANGLTQAIVKFILWNGYRATRISSSGRIVKSSERQASGTVLQTAKYIPGATRRGSADISATIKGRSIMFEVKIGSDKPSEYQLREKELEEKAGGLYFFVKTFEEFLNIYDEQISKAHCSA